MKSKFLILAIFFSISTSAQESRIALVIGNSSYEKGALRNPVNDALLMQTTFQNLGFDVILDTNINTRDRFITTISNFLDKRVNYNVAFVYYAGHAVQIGGENYMLATEETYNSERDARNFGVNINDFIEDYQDPVANKINVLIIDACRNNPFEKNWIAQNRSLESGLGLAEMKNPPSGTIIAYSTQPGLTADDGNDKNSLYCLSLAQNFELEGVRIEDAFARVRKDIRISSDGRQVPNYTNDLEGNAFYLKKTDLTNHIIEIDSLIDAGSSLSLISAREKISALLALHPNDKRCLLRKGKLEIYNESIEYDGADLFKADKLFPNDSEVKLFIARYYKEKKEFKNALKEIENSISLNTDGVEAYEWKAKILLEAGDTAAALTCFSRMIEIEKDNPKRYAQRAAFFIESGEFPNALMDLDKAIQLAPDEAVYYNNRGAFYWANMKIASKAIQDYDDAFQLATDNYQKSRAEHNKSNIYKQQAKYELAIEGYTKAIELDPEIWQSYSNRAKVYKETEQFELALKDYSKAIELDNETPAERYYDRANFFILLEEYPSALKDLDKAIELSPNATRFNDRADFYSVYMLNDKKAIDDHASAFELAIDDLERARTWNNRALIYKDQEKFDLAIQGFSEAIKLAPQSSEAWKFHMNRADVYKETEQFELALKDYTKAIELDNETPAERYYDRANFFILLEDNTNALKDLDKAIELSPTATSFNDRADFYTDYMLNDKKAIDDYARAFELTSDDFERARTWNNRAIIYEAQEKYDLAIQGYSEAIKIDTTTALYFANRANVYMQSQQFDLALQDCNKAISLEPSNLHNYIQRGELYLTGLNRPYNALIDFSNAITLDSLESEGWAMRAMLFYEEWNDNKSAIEDILNIVELDSNNVVALFLIGVLCYEMLEEENAINYFQKSISKIGVSSQDSTLSNEYIAWSYSYLGEIFKLKNDRSISNNYFNLANKYDDKDPDLYETKAWFLEIYYQNHIEALNSIKRAIELDGANPEYELTLAKILLHSNKMIEAETSFKKALDKSEQSSRYYSELANFYSSQGEYKKADKFFEKAFASDTISATLYHHKTEHLIRQSLFDDALALAKEATNKFKNDTASFDQIGRIYMTTKEYISALQAYNQALAIMEFDDTFRYIDDSEIQVFSSDVCLKIYEIYTILNETSLACEMLNRAEAHAQIETRPDNLIIQEKIKSLKLSCPN